MDRYRGNSLVLCEMRCKNFGETTEEGHKVFSSEKEDKHEHGIEFIVHKVFRRLITIHLRAVPCNITVAQAYAPTSDYDDSEIEEFYDQLENVIDQKLKKNILVVQGDLNAKEGKDAYETGKAFTNLSAMTTQMRGFRLLEFATFNNLVLADIWSSQSIQKRHLA